MFWLQSCREQSRENAYRDYMAEMKSVGDSWTARLRYAFDNYMARGTIALIGGLFVLLILFTVRLQWFETGPGGWQNLVLPALCLALPAIGRLSIVVRSLAARLSFSASVGMVGSLLRRSDPITKPGNTLRRWLDSSR